MCRLFLFFADSATSKILHEESAFLRRGIQRENDVPGGFEMVRRWLGGGDDVLEIGAAVRLLLDLQRQLEKLGVWDGRHVGDLGAVVDEEAGMVATAHDAAEERS